MAYGDLHGGDDKTFIVLGMKLCAYSSGTARNREPFQCVTVKAMFCKGQVIQIKYELRSENIDLD